MLGAYSMFPSGGVNVQPLFITKIEDKNGALIKSFVPEQKELINNKTAYKMIKLMRGVVDFGTARRLRFRYGFKADIAGKTGTTNSQTDAWFIGYTPQILAGAWVGHDDNYLRFNSQDLGQGSAAALPIWGIFMTKVFANKKLDIRQDVQFKEPDGFDDCDVIDPTSLQRSHTYSSSGTVEDNTKEDKEQIPTGEYK
jgi:penicillin-binding protein 1A